MIEIFDMVDPRKKTQYDLFNKTAKRLLKDMREAFNETSKAFTVLLIALKVTKHLGRKMPRRFFDEMLFVPYGDRMRAKDTDFFTSDAFDVPSFDDTVRSIKGQIVNLTEEERDAVWARVAELIQIRDQCHELESSDTSSAKE